MSQSVIEALRTQFQSRILAESNFRGDESVEVAPSDWVQVVTFLRDTAQMNHFVDLTAVDYPERDDARFEVLVSLRSIDHNHRIRVKTSVRVDEAVPTLVDVFCGANWAEREVWDMFGITFDGHPDLRRILMYDEFEGHPLRKDYPIEKAQPLVPYRDTEGLEKLPPFGADEGQPFARIDWQARVSGADHQVSPALGVQSGTRRALSDSEIAEERARHTPTPPRLNTETDEG